MYLVKQIGIDEFCDAFDKTENKDRFNLIQKKMIFEFLEEEAQKQEKPLEINITDISNSFEVFESIYELTENNLDIKNYSDEDSDDPFDEQEAINDLSNVGDLLIEEVNEKEYIIFRPFDK